MKKNQIGETCEPVHLPIADAPTNIEPIKSIPVMPSIPTVATVHQIGCRDSQQDSLGYASVMAGKGFIAVVADGMGGLSGGEKVSQKIVIDTLSMAHPLQPGQADGVLWKFVDAINSNVNRMLGPDGLYKSGSTLSVVLTYGNHFQWISVGDSRIYLYRDGRVQQLNQDHNLFQKQMADVSAGKCTLEEALQNPNRGKLTSFIGMGQLKYIDGSRSLIPLQSGDRLVLMSDGIYNIVSEYHLTNILKGNPDVKQAVSAIDRMICDRNHPYQDNYTAIVLGF